ncbi:phage GP46 family protein [Enterobacter hormaechei]|uniref:phage GP46 family protein n=1 Tax=Enterobacter hormaechei TaxID=158836 RepID=UPI0007991AA9|nr:phage GP46 family protein [Enterobacter hormaechei]CZX92357.1 phage GP46 family protein [Enterobacter hormaechei]
MSDIKTVWKIDSGGWVSETGDLASGDDLGTAVLISLFTDQQARADDTYDGNDRRGWWGDLGEDYRIGSRLWLVYRQRLSRDTAEKAKDYAREALQWMLDDLIAESVEVTYRIVYPSSLYLYVEIKQPDGTKRSFEFDWAWGEIANAV